MKYLPAFVVFRFTAFREAEELDLVSFDVPWERKGGVERTLRRTDHAIGLNWMTDSFWDITLKRMVSTTL